MEISARELAAFCGGEIEGDPAVTVSDFAKIEEAGPGQLSFIANPKYAHHAASTHASVLLVSNDFEAPKNLHATLIRVSDPYATLARLMTMVADARPKPQGIENPVHVGEGTVLPSDIYLGTFSYIGKNVTLGNGAKIYPQVYVGDGCSIGADTILYPGVKIYAGCKVGARCIIHAGAVVGADGFGFAPVDGHYEKIPQMGSVVIEDDVEIGANTTIDRATFGTTVIGRGTKLDNLIQIAHNVTLGEDNVIAAQAGVAGSTKIGSRNRIGGQVGFAGHIRIGNNNEIGAQSGLHSDVGDNCRLIGYPATEVRKFARNIVNLNRLAEFLSAQKEEKHDKK